jgi:membrane-bound lytic murein transglycosylase D
MKLVSVIHALGRRKIETVTIAAFAAVSALGIARRDADATPASVIISEAVGGSAVEYLAAAVAKSPSVSAKKTLGLANIEHPRVQSWIKRFTTDLRGSFETYLDRKDKYEPMISTKLARRGMPQGLIYLAMIESGFNPKVKSSAKASGMWQFMSPTARRYGLKVNRRVDERNNPSRATDAALKYLGDLHERFGSWYLAAAAYNAGEGTVTKALKRVTGRTRGTDADYYRISPRLPSETRDYVPKLVAAARIGSNPTRYGFAD